MPKNIPSLSPKKLGRILNSNGCRFYREGKVDHRLFIREIDGRKKIVPLDMGAKELSPVYVLRILRQFGLTDKEIEKIFHLSSS